MSCGNGYLIAEFVVAAASVMLALKQPCSLKMPWGSVGWGTRSRTQSWQEELGLSVVNVCQAWPPSALRAMLAVQQIGSCCGRARRTGTLHIGRRPHTGQATVASVAARLAVHAIPGWARAKAR